MLSVTSQSYYMPALRSVPTEETGSAYFEEVKDFFVNTLKFFVVGEKRTFVDPTVSNSISYGYFLSDKQNGNPNFCLHTMNCPDENRYERIILEPCTFNGIDYLPLKMPISSRDDIDFPDEEHTGCVCTYSDQPYAISFYVTGDYNCDMRKNTVIVQDVKFRDGRRVIFFKSQTRDTYEWRGNQYWGALFFTNIVFQNNMIQDWVIFSTALGGSYNPTFDRHIVNKNITDDLTNFINLQRIVSVFPRIQGGSPCYSSSPSGGLLPGLYGGKDYLIKQNFYIGDEAYIPDIYRYSNLSSIALSDDKSNLAASNKGKMGDYITIKNSNYLILCNRIVAPDYSVLDQRTEGYDISKIEPGCFANEGYYYAGRSKSVNTESLVILI